MEVLEAATNEQQRADGQKKQCFLEDASSGVNTDKPAGLDQGTDFYKRALFVQQSIPTGKTRTGAHK